MNLKINRRQSLVWNMVFYCVLSLLFLHVILSLHLDVSAIHQERFKEFLLGNKYLVGYTLLVIISFLKMHRLSKLLFPLLLGVIFIQSTILLFQDFDKLILLMTFFLILIGHFLHHMWGKELERSYYNPLISGQELNSFPVVPIKARCLDPKGREIGYGFLTNWDEEGCFIRFISPLQNKNKNVVVEIEFEGRLFSQPGFVISSFGHFSGVGIRFHMNRPSHCAFNWKDFYGIIVDHGYLPTYS